MNGKEQKLTEIEDVLDKIKKEFQVVRTPNLPESEQVKEFKAWLSLGKPVYLSYDTAKQVGIDIDFPENWTLKVTPGKNLEDMALTFQSPEGLEILPEDIFETAEGEWISRQQVETMEAEAEAMEASIREAKEAELAEIGSLFMQLFPEMIAPPTMREPSMLPLFTRTEYSDENLAKLAQQYITEISEDGEAQELFFEAVYKQGRKPETERLLKLLIPEMTDEDLNRFFEPLPEQLDITEQATRELGKSWHELTTGEFSWGELGRTFLSLFGVVGSYVEKYVGRPWEVAILELNARIKGLGLPGDKPPNTFDRYALAKIDEAFDKYGWTAIFSQEVGRVWEFGYEIAEPGKEWTKAFFEWTNPVYFIPIGGAFGLVAKFTGKIPLLCKFTKFTAAGVQATERGMMYPVTKPIQLTAQGLNKIGVKLGEKLANKLVNQTGHLLLEIPESERLLEGVLVDNWMKTTLKVASKLPGMKAVITKGIGIGEFRVGGLGWRILVDKSSNIVQDVVGRAGVVHAEISRMGLNARSVVLQDLRSIEMNPTKLFGFGKEAFSSEMAARLLPEYASEKGIAGTLEHVFTHPEMYNWAGMSRGLEYVTRVYEVNQSVLNLLTKEGVRPEHVMEDWIHRVVTGRTAPGGADIPVKGKPGVAGRAIAKTPSYEKPRTFKNMAEGLSHGVKYDPNIETSIGTYIEEAFNKIAGERFKKYVAEYGVTPLERLLERFPEIAERAELTKIELADAAKLQSVINRAIRGERLPTQTLDAIERRFPEIGRKLRILSQEPAKVEGQLRELLNNNDRLIRNLEQRLKKAEAIDIEAIKREARTEAIAKGIPDDQKLYEAFKIMDYDDRLAFRETMNRQGADIQNMVYEQSAELDGLLEWYSSEQATKLVNLTKKMGWYKGEVSNLTIAQYKKLTGKSEILPNILTKDKKHVRWEYALDEVATEMGYKSGENLKYAIERMAETKVKIDDLKLLNKMGQDRAKGIERMLKVLDDVDTKPQFTPKAEAGMPEAGAQQDMFGYQHPVYPKGKGEITQISMDDYGKLVETYKKAGLPPPDAGIKPKIEGIKGLEAETTFKKVDYELPVVKTAAQRKAELEALRGEAKALVETRKAPYWQAKAERAAKMEICRQPGIGEGYIMQPFAGGKIYSQEFIDAFNKFFGYDPGLKVLRVTSDVAGILRITKAALDFSQMAIQGLPSWGLAHAYMIINPVIGSQLMGSWYKAFGISVASFFEPKVFAKYMARKNAIALQRVSFGGSSKAVDYFAALQTAGWTEKALGKIPLKPYHRAEISFFAAGEVVRNEFWEALSKKALSRGQGFELARFLDRITGLTEARYLGVPTTVRQIEQSFMWFAPNYTRACLTVLADIFRGGLTGAETRKALGGMIAAGGVMYSGVQYSLAILDGKSPEEAWESVMEGFGVVKDPITGELSWKPSAKFMTINIGNYNFGFGGFWYGLLRLSGNITACINEVGEREVIDLVRIIKHGSLNKKDNPFIYWWYSRSSPFFGAGFEMATGKDFLGYPIETGEQYAQYIASRFEPIWMEQGINWMIPGLARDNEIPEGLAREAIVPAELFGLRTFPESTWVNFYDAVNEYIKRMHNEDFIAFTDPDKATEDDEAAFRAWKEGKLTWAQLTDDQKIELFSRYPELYEFYQEAEADSAIRDNDIWKAWEGVTDSAKDTYYKRGDNLIDRVKTGELDTRELRELWSDAGQNYGIALDTIEKDPHYEDIYNRFSVLEEKGDKYEFTANIALTEYQAIMFTDYIDENGDIDWDRKDAEVDAFIEKWGEEMYSVIRDMYADKRLLEGLNPALVRMAEDKNKLGREYWRLPYKPIYEMDAEDEAEGNIPAEYYELWKQYQAIEDEDEREAFIEANPDIAKDWRAEYRKENPEADAMLALWGYSGKLQSMEAYELLLKWGRELGIPLEQMGLGLPPRSLIENYFEHADLVRETSGSSVEVRLYKLEHPEFLDWGVENWGWDELSDESIDALRLRVEHKDLFSQYEGYGDRKSELYIEDEDARVEAREKLLSDNPEFRDDRWRVDAYTLGFPDNLIENYVEYSNLTVKGFEQERYLLEHSDFYQSMIDLKDIVPFDPGYKVPSSEYDAIYHKWEELFEQYENVTGSESQRKKAREQILVENPEFAYDRRRREAYGMFIPDHLVENYAEYYTSSPKKADDPWYEDNPNETFYGDDWWLMDHMEFYETMVEMGFWQPRDFSKVPTKEVYNLYRTYLGLPQGNPREDFRAKNPELDAWLVLKFDYKPIEDRGNKEAEKTPWEEQQDVERFKELFS